MFLLYKNLLSNTPTEVFSAVWQGLSRPLIHDQAKGYAPFLNQSRTNRFDCWICDQGVSLG